MFSRIAGTAGAPDKESLLRRAETIVYADADDVIAYRAVDLEQRGSQRRSGGDQIIRGVTKIHVQIFEPGRPVAVPKPTLHPTADSPAVLCRRRVAGSYDATKVAPEKITIALDLAVSVTASEVPQLAAGRPSDNAARRAEPIQFLIGADSDPDATLEGA
jgi:hypothetical protein